MIANPAREMDEGGEGEANELDEDRTSMSSTSPATHPGRKIIHIDMDAFYASVEQRDDPSLHRRPVAVGGSSRRGVVAAASYEARAFGVRSAMPSVTAQRRCPELVFVKPRFEVYKAISAEIREIFAEHTAIIEPLSLDEAYLDVTVNRRGIASATEIARLLRARIREATGLTASAGVSYNKFLAKLASDHRKPDGLFVVAPGQGEAFVADLPVGRFHGVGPATAAKMERLGIRVGRDLRARSVEDLRTHFGKIGPYYHGIARGVDERAVRANRIRKSIGAENTFSDDLHEEAKMRQALGAILDKVWRYCETNAIHARTATLKIKYSDFRQITRARSQGTVIASRSELEAIAFRILGDRPPSEKGVRLLGLSLSQLGHREHEAEVPAQFDLPL